MPHCPLPWRYEVIGQNDRLENVCTARDARDRDVADCLDEGDAAFIVKCANAHDALVAALEQVIAAYSDILSSDYTTRRNPDPIAKDPALIAARELLAALAA